MKNIAVILSLIMMLIAVAYIIFLPDKIGMIVFFCSLAIINFMTQIRNDIIDAIKSKKQ